MKNTTSNRRLGALKALAAELWAYFNASNFESGILKIINEGGDADTNACFQFRILS